MNVPFLDLWAQHQPLEAEIHAEWADILESGAFVSGRRVAQFEAEFAEAHEVAECIAVNSGTDALFAALWAFGVGPQVARGERLQLFQKFDF